MITRSKTQQNNTAFKQTNKRNRSQTIVSEKTTKGLRKVKNKLARAKEMLSQCRTMRRKLEIEKKTLLKMKLSVDDSDNYLRSLNATATLSHQR
jgi:hypothetical protein